MTWAVKIRQSFDDTRADPLIHGCKTLPLSNPDEWGHITGRDAHLFFVFRVWLVLVHVSALLFEFREDQNETVATICSLC
jgi:hypothetical protein